MFLRILRKALLLTLGVYSFFLCFPQTAIAGEYENLTDLGLSAQSAILMDVGTGSVLYVKNADEALPPASVTKVMTLLLIYEAQEAGAFRWEDPVQVSAHAASMGGSQLWLEQGETQTAADMTKCIVIASANDAAVAMAELIAGSEEAFVERMNEKAQTLGMKNTHFVNACGLDAEGHVTSARDIAIMSRELLMRFPEVSDYATTRLDAIIHKTKRGESEFGLTNTNKMIQWYEGTTGLKTGSTDLAKFCLSGSARRNGLHLVAVVMAAPDGTTRFRETMKLLDYGFANYAAVNGDPAGTPQGEVTVQKGRTETVPVVNAAPATGLVPKTDAGRVEKQMALLPQIAAPVPAGAVVGSVVYTVDGKEVARADLVTAVSVEKVDFPTMAGRLLRQWLL